MYKAHFEYIKKEEPEKALFSFIPSEKKTVKFCNPVREVNMLTIDDDFTLNIGGELPSHVPYLVRVGEEGRIEYYKVAGVDGSQKYKVVRVDN